MDVSPCKRITKKVDSFYKIKRKMTCTHARAQRSSLVSFPSAPKSIAPIVVSSDPTTMMITNTVRITVGIDDWTSARTEWDELVIYRT